MARTVMSWSHRIWHDSRTPVRPRAVEPLLFGIRVLGRLSGDELDPAGRAAGVAAAGVQDVHVGILLDRQDQPLVIRHVERSISFNRQLGHPTIV